MHRRRSSPHHPPWLSILLGLALVLGSLLPVAQVSAQEGPAAPSGGTISGLVFRDYNENGTKDGREIGVGNVQVRVYDSAGVKQGETTTFPTVCAGNNSPAGLGCTGVATPALGSYSVSAGGTGPYRVEFTSFPSGVYPSARSTDSVGGGTATNGGTTVQFVSDGSTANVNVALNNPRDYSQANPRLVTNSYVIGDQTGAQATLFSHDYTGGGLQEESQANQIGTTWGLAYRSSTNRLYAAAFLKRATGFGLVAAENRAGQIYVITPNGSGANVGAPFVVIPNAGADPHSNMDAFNSDTDFDNGAFALVGKRGLGDIEFSDDESTLFAVNLNDKKLYSVNMADSVITDRGVIPSPTCTNGVARPFGLGFRDGTLYVGGVCDASAGGTAANLQAYIYSYTLSGGFSAAPVIQFPLSFNRTCADSGGFGAPIPTCRSGTIGPDADWRPWTDTLGTIITSSTFQPSNGGEGSYPMPLVTDIVFDGEDMVIGMRDRTGDMLGFNDPGPTQTLPTPFGGSYTLLKYSPAGDILRANPNGSGGWTIENTSNSNPAGIFGPTDGAGNLQGPGGGEFYLGDFNQGTLYHDENGVGGLTQVPGFNEVVYTAYDPTATTFTGGTTQLSDVSVHPLPVAGTNDLGKWVRGQVVYNDTNNGSAAGNRMGKGNGMGDCEALSAPAPIELGNRVWRDTNGNGIQDPGEAGISGVTVQLWCSASQVGTAVTDTNGEYYFVDSTAADPTPGDNIGQVNGGIPRNTACEVRVAAAQGSLSGLRLTTQNAAQPANGDAAATTNDPIKDVADSDGALSGANAVIAYTTGGGGVNNHGLDFGFAPSDWGDLPDSFGTLSTSNGPNHALSANLLLGACVDSEANGQPDPSAGMITASTGDDGNQAGAPTSSLPVGVTCTDDENGVTLVTPLVAGGQACVAVTAVNTTGGAANLWGWIDFNGDGAFTTGEALTGGAGGTGGNFAGGVATIVDGYTGSNPATNQFCFQVPAAATFDGGETHMRFRLTTDTLTTSSWVGSASNGEVEDYYSQLACVGNLVWQDTDKNGIQDTGEPFLNTTVYMVWAGPDATVQTTDGATTAAGDDRIYSVATAAGKYQFCGVVPGTYQIKVVTPPAGFSYATTPNAAAAGDNKDSDGAQSAADAPSVIPAFAIASITTLPTGENGLSDGSPINSFPDAQENRSYDFGFTATPTAVALRTLQAAPQSPWEAVLELLRQLAQPAAR